MWVIRIIDKNTRKIQFIREFFFDGAVIYFEHEEEALRVSVPLSKLLQEYFGISCRPEKNIFNSGKERRRKISSGTLDRTLEDLKYAIGWSAE